VIEICQLTVDKLPLSFGTSIFGMNTKEFNGGNWDFRTEMIYTCSSPLLFLSTTLSSQIPQILPNNNLIVPISIAIIFISFLLAFSTFTRAGLSFIFDLTWWNFITSTRIYSLWMEFKLDSADLNERRLKTIRRWKESAKDDWLKRSEEKAKAAKKAAETKAAMAASGVGGDRRLNSVAGGVEMGPRGDSAV
jgi:hypothetical protein